MKMHVLAAAVLAALASQVVMAASEGGDTWSDVQPIQHPSTSVVRSAPPVDSQRATDVAFEGSEGGDTWSSLEAVREPSSKQAIGKNRPGRTTTTYVGALDWSEGGDTWARFVPQLEGQPTSTASVSAATVSVR